MTWLDFTDFCVRYKFPDAAVRPANLDLLFVTVAAYDKGRGGLMRGEFIELLLRVAKLNYFDTGKAKSVSEAFELLINNQLLPNYYPTEWQQLRETQFWNIPVNDMLAVNEDGLKKIFGMYGTKVKKWMTPEETWDLLTNLLDKSRLSIKGSKVCYVMSKMTVVDQKKRNDQYLQLQFVEFLEVLCRAAMYWDPVTAAAPKNPDASGREDSQEDI